MASIRLPFSTLNPLLVIIIVCFSIAIAKGCVERERDALLDFKKSFSSFPKDDDMNSPWNVSNLDCCWWDGIFCDDSKVHVVQLGLSDLGLESNHLRPSLLELQHLQYLDLSGNNLSMRIPEFFGSFKELNTLDLSNAGFYGSIPPQLANLSSLESLGLGPIDLSEPRDWLLVTTKLPLLSTFFCDSCSFPSPDKLPTTPANSSSSQLQTLGLFYTVVSSSTLSLFLNTAPNLSSFELQSVDWQVPSIDVFDQIGKFCNLESLSIFSCSIKHSFSEVIQALGSGCASDSLQSLGLSSNNLRGLIPPMLMFRSLTELYLGDNQLEGFATDNSTFQSPNPHQASHIFPKNLSTLSIPNNRLSGVFLSEYFVSILHLHHLDISHHPNLTVSLNEPPRQVQVLNLNSCNLGPGIPTWLPALKKLEYLNIAESNISGYIPRAFWGNLSSHIYLLNLSNNNLLGTIPELQPFQDLRILDLSSNGFYGSLPPFLFRLTHLGLSKNNFTSFATLPHHVIPTFPIYYIIITMLDISYNNMSGVIPNWAWSAISLFSSIDLSNNNFSGRVPSFNNTQAKQHLYVLNLSNNRFFGQIPSFPKNSWNMRILDLSKNRFSGLIPSWIGEDLSSSLAILSVGSNNLTGTLPRSLCHLSSLQILDLSHNELSGTIPSCVNNFVAMTHDVQSSNELYTPIEMDGIIVEDVPLVEGAFSINGVLRELVPMIKAQFYQDLIKWKGIDQLFHKNLEFLNLIDLSYNKLSGEIPGELMSLIALDSLDLSSNNFTGSIPSQIGQLKDLEYLNLSFNSISGPIPTGLADITTLGMLDLSHNNLSGRIPKGSQLQTFKSSAFTANSGLCGEPLEKCPGDVDDSLQPLQLPSATTDEGDEGEDKVWFYAGSGAGFACGFLGIIATLTWIKEWRYAFFGFATELGEWMLLVVALGASKISRKLRFK